jgi:hypothetical protein
MLRRCLAVLIVCAVCPACFAGYDATGVAVQMSLDAAGNLWFRLNNTNADSYCALGWYNNNLYVPATDPSFAFYYGIVLASVSKSQALVVPNISVFNGTTSCDITKTGYGLMLRP